MTTPAQMVAALPLQLGFRPAESLVVMCCHEPRGRVGLTLRIDLPAAKHEELLAEDIIRRVRQQKATRVVLFIYTEAEGFRPRDDLMRRLTTAFEDIIVTEALLVRAGRFYSYTCFREQCCPAEGTPVEAAAESSSVRILEAEQVALGQVVMPSREALEASLAPPSFLAAEAARQRCELAVRDYRFALEETRGAWEAAIARYENPPWQLGNVEAAELAVSLIDIDIRDDVAATHEDRVPALLLLLEELCRRTPPPYDVPVCTLFAWLTYSQGAGPMVTIALERALTTDPDYSMARLLLEALNAHVEPEVLRRATEGVRAGRQPRRRQA